MLPKLEVMHHADVLTDTSEDGKLANFLITTGFVATVTGSVTKIMLFAWFWLIQQRDTPFIITHFSKGCSTHCYFESYMVTVSNFYKIGDYCDSVKYISNGVAHTKLP